MIENVTGKELITNSVSNQQELENLIDKYADYENIDLKDFVDLLKSNTTNNEIKAIYQDFNSKKEFFIKHTIATRYLESISKGLVAQELAIKIMMINMKNNNEEDVILNVPKYIKEAIEWTHQ